MRTLGAIGECMLEFRQHAGVYKLGYGGDVFNTAVYATRLGLDVRFITATGDDHYSQYLLDAWVKEGIDTDTVRILPGKTPGLYIIETDETGERSFHYWRDTTPFKQLLASGDYLDQLPRRLRDLDCVYFSGISLALFSEADRTILLDLLGEYRRSGGQVAFDANYRPRLWQSPTEAREWIESAYGVSDIVLPSFDDEQLLASQQESGEGNNLNHTLNNTFNKNTLTARLHDLGASEVIIKDGANGAQVSRDGEVHAHTPDAVSHVIDTTAAGDSFNGAYLAERITSGDHRAALVAGCYAAAQVIQHAGAIIPETIPLTP